MKHLQCLLPKPPDWQPEDGDEDYEIDATKCFVSGISTRGPYEFDVADLMPVKHGISEAMISNRPYETVGRSTPKTVHTC